MNESGIPSIHPKLSDVKDNSEVMDFLESTIRETELAMLEEYERQRKNITELLKKETHSLDGYFDQDQEMGRRGKEKALLYFNLQSKINQASNQISSEVLKNAIAEGLQRGKQWYNNWEKRENLTLLVFDSIDANIRKIQRLIHFEDLEKGVGAQQWLKNTDNCASDARIEADWDESSKETARKEETNLTGSNSGERINSCIEEAKLQNQNSREDRGEVPIVLEKSNGDADNEERTVWRDEEPVENSRSGIFAENHEEPEDANQLDSSNGDVTQNEEDVKVPDLSRDGHVSCDTKNADSSGSKEIFPSSLEPWEPSLKCADKNGGNDEDKFEGPLLNLDKESDLSIKSGDISIENKEVPLVDNEVSVPQGTCDSICPGSTRKISENSDKDTNPNDTNSSNGSEEQEASKDQEPESLSSSKKPDDENNSESNVSEQFDNTLNNANVSVSSKPDGESAKDDESQSSVSDNQRNPTQNKEENLEISAKEETKSQEEKSTSEKASSKNEEVEDPQDSQPGQANDGPEASESQQEEKKDSSNIQDDSEENIHRGASGSDPLETSDETQIAEKSDTSAAREGKQEELKHENEDNDKDGEMLGVNDGGNNSDGFEEQKKIENEQKTQEGPAEYPKISKENDAPKEASEEDAQKALEIVEPDSSTPGEEPLAQNPSVYNTDGIPQDNTENYYKEVDTANTMDQPGNSKYQDDYFEISYLEVETLSENDHQNQDDQDISGNGETEDKEEDKVPEEDSKDNNCENDDITGSGEHSQNSEAVGEKKLEDCHNGYDSSNNSDDLKAPNDHESQESDYSLNEKLHQDDNLNETTLKDTNKDTVEESKDPIYSGSINFTRISFETIPQPALERKELADLEAQKYIEDEQNNPSDMRNSELNNKNSEEIFQNQDSKFPGFIEEGLKSDSNEESKEKNQDSWEGDKKSSIPSQTSEDSINRVEHTSWTNKESSKNAAGESQEGLNPTHDIQNLGSSNEDKFVTEANVDALDKSWDDQTPTNRVNNNSNELGEHNQESDENSSSNNDHQTTNPNYSEVDATISEKVQANIPRDSAPRSNLSEKSEGIPESDDQDPSGSVKDLKSDQDLNSMIPESTGGIGDTSNGSDTLEGADKDLDNRPAKEGMAEEKKNVVSPLLGKSDDLVNKQTNSLEDNEANLNGEDNPVADEWMNGSVEDKMKSLDSVAHSQGNSFRTQKGKPQQIIDDDNSKHELKTGIQNNDSQKEKSYKHQKDQSKEQNEEIKNTLHQRDTMNDPNYEENKYKDGQNWGNSFPLSSQEHSSKAKNAANPMNTIRKDHQNDPLSKPETGYHHEQNPGAKSDLSQEGYNQYQKSSHEAHDDSKGEDDEIHSWNGEEDQPETDEGPSSKIDPNYNPFDNDEECKLPQEIALNDDGYEFVHKGFENYGNNCFMNSILQMLLSLPEFIEYFKLLPHKSSYWSKIPTLFSKKKQKPLFTKEMKNLMRYWYKEKFKIIKPNALRKLSKDEFPLGDQNDACKYMLHLFENLQNEFDPSVPHFVSSGYENYAEAWTKYQEDHSSIIDQLFVGMYETVISCNKCNDETRIYEEFINVPLTIETDEKGSKYLEFFENQKEISPSEFNCPSCKEITRWTIFKRICKAPKYLMLSIQRFDDFTQEKDNDYVHYPPTFRLELPGKKKAVYDLKSVVCHLGGLEFGHYLAFCKRGRYWRDYNDDSVKYSNIYRATNEDAYMLAYKVRYYE